MSRIGNRPIPVPKNVTVEIEGQTVRVKGPRGSLEQSFRPDVTRAVRLLMNARARREAVSHMDRGDYAAAAGVVAGARAATLAYCAAQPGDEEARADSEELLRVTGSLNDRGRDKMSRKLLEYSSLLRRTGRKTR